MPSPVRPPSRRVSQTLLQRGVPPGVAPKPPKGGLKSARRTPTARHLNRGATRQMTRPSPGSMVYWRFRSPTPGPFQFGYVTYRREQLIRMGLFNGDTWSGPIVDPVEIEWKPY